VLDKILGARKTEPQSPHQTAFLPLRSTAGIDLSEEQALAYSAVFSAVKVISETVAMLPWRVYRENGEAKELQAGSRLDRVLHRTPNTEMTAFTFREYLVSCALLWGNGYAEIERNRAGDVIGLWPLHPSAVEPTRDGQGQLIYRVWDERGGKTDLSVRSVYHLRGPTKDGVVGRSMISVARESFGLGIAMEQFGAAFFGNGGVPSTVITQDENAPDLNQEAARNLLSSFERRHKGAKNAGKPALLEPGQSIQTVGIPQDDAQFLESRKFQVTEVSRWFRLPPHKISDMEAATYSNIEQQAIDFVVDSIQPWTERMEQEADAKLVGRRDLITKIKIQGLMRGDSEARANYYNTLWNLGSLSTNDIRSLEDMNPVPNGDKRFVPLNMVTLDSAASSGNTDPARDVVAEATERMLNKEKMAAQRSHERGKDYRDWAPDFYERHEGQLYDSLIHGARTVAALHGLDESGVADQVRKHCREHVERSLRDIANGDWDQWDRRAAAETDKLLERLVGASHE